MPKQEYETTTKTREMVLEESLEYLGANEELSPYAHNLISKVLTDQRHKVNQESDKPETTKSQAFPHSGIFHSGELQRMADAIHYPAHWDTAAYPNLSSAIYEIVTNAECSECNTPVYHPEFLKGEKKDD